MDDVCEFVVSSDNILVDLRNGKSRIVFPDLNLTSSQAKTIACLSASSVTLSVEIKEKKS